jgi:type IV secretion system protein VirD4
VKDIRQNKENGILTLALWAAVYILMIWFALIVASIWKSGDNILDLVEKLTSNFDPIYIQFSEYSMLSVIIFSIIFGMIVSSYYASVKNIRTNEEHGSASWGIAKQVNRLFSQNKMKDILLTQNVSIGLDTHKHKRNLNVLVVGGSGSGKSRFYVRPNIMQMNTSFVVTDPKKELLRETGQMLKDNGYEVKVLNLINFEESDSYNPFRYIRADIDVIKLINNLIANTTPKGSQSSDPFWLKSETALLQALMFYLVYEAPENEQNFSMIMTMLEYAGASEEDENMVTALDVLFQQLEKESPNHIAVKQYKVYKQASGKTAKSILVSCAVRLAAFNLKQVKDMTSYDDMDIEQLAKNKTAIFAVTPDNDSSFNFLVGLLYTQVFQEMYYMADHVYGGQLPIPLHVCMDEFANIALPDEFDKILSTMRSRNISASVILQNLAQLKGLFKQSPHAWETIVGNCDSFVYLGGNERSSHEYVSKLLGKSTIHLKTYNRSMGKNGSYTTNNQITGRELLTPDEVRLIDNEYAIVFIRGAYPVIDKKYNLLKHPCFKQTSEGGNAPYIYEKKIRTQRLVDSIDLDRAEDYEILYDE